MDKRPYISFDVDAIDPARVPGQLSKEMLAGRWDISHVSARMIKKFKEKYNMK